MDWAGWTHGNESYPKVKVIPLGDYELSINLHRNGETALVHLYCKQPSLRHLFGTWVFSSVVHAMCFASLVQDHVGYRIRVIEQCRNSTKMLQEVPDCEGLEL